MQFNDGQWLSLYRINAQRTKQTKNTTAAGIRTKEY